MSAASVSTPAAKESNHLIGPARVGLLVHLA